ncbi:sugar ABC transporter substrate-binding protein [Gracilibacillus caseinilyticus]|uniref:Sugar ABC transporter substrate-binding protein n=1 Tax=Gracilibacillus caseinilyticus TaxID=2932256 RepID=A0ABY4EVC9_9BACI|nr:sugar ABC transporter substrate-binding protein [Gracilibacillus caseinilyticus]UOQ48351.1 sugar ABC transporter substrate-binding protein [Gracilibacillus caseinilyticus]
MFKTLSKIMVLLLVTLGLLAACSSGESNDPDKTTLTFWNRLPELTTQFEDFIATFEEEHPDIQIDMQTLGASGNQQYQTAIKNNELPDIFVTANVTSLQNLVDQDLLHNLNDVVTPEVKEEFYPGVWSENFTTIGEDIYQLPLNSGKSSILMYYNKDVLKEYGISEEQIPSTWDEMLEVGKDIYDQSGGGVYGLIMGAEANWLSDMTINQMATNITPDVHPSIDVARQLNYKTGNPDFLNDGNVETIEYLKTLMDENVLSPSSVEYNESTAIANFAAGKSAFYFDGNWAGSVIMNDEEGPGFENWGVAPMPTKDGGAYYSDMVAKEGLMVSNNTEHWEEVQTFLSYFIENGYQDVIVESGAHEPPMDLEVSDPPFEQYNKINEINGENSIATPSIYEKNSDTIGFIQDYQGGLSYSTGSILAGYLQGEVSDPSAELEKAQEEAQNVFDENLEKYENVNQSDFVFDDWVPFEPYTTE